MNQHWLRYGNASHLTIMAQVGSLVVWLIQSPGVADFSPAVADIFSCAHICTVENTKRMLNN